jgi:hypothetical protein
MTETKSDHDNIDYNTLSKLKVFKKIVHDCITENKFRDEYQLYYFSHIIPVKSDLKKIILSWLLETVPDDKGWIHYFRGVFNDDVPTHNEKSVLCGNIFARISELSNVKYVKENTSLAVEKLLKIAETQCTYAYFILYLIPDVVGSGTNDINYLLKGINSNDIRCMLFAMERGISYLIDTEVCKTTLYKLSKLGYHNSDFL